MSISQFITARIYAKKMIEFLRMRQEIKRIEAERIVRIKKRNERLRELKRDNIFQIFINCSYPEASNRLSTNQLLQFDFFQNKINQNDIRFIVSYLICIYYFFIF